MPKGFVYILECSDGSYYAESALDYEARLKQHQDGKGANHTKNRLPVKLVYLEEHQGIDVAFNREKQIQGWSRTKKEALINGELNKLPEILEGTTPENLKLFSSNGKLLLTGEYLVLDGAKSLALPTTYGQQLLVKKTKKNTIFWKSYNEENSIWFQDEFNIKDLLSGYLKSENEVSSRLIQVLRSVIKLNPNLLNTEHGFDIKTTQDFNRSWGLGTSSTLINNIANWADVDAYKLLELTFGGSGYDIACAQNDGAITYQLENKTPLVRPVDFRSIFKDNIFFVYLNQKQNSRDGIASYRKYDGDLSNSISKINSITTNMISCKSLENFEHLIIEHEEIISKIINQKPVKKRLFNDFDGAVKSLGAWGGDFVMVTSKDNPTDYFMRKGYEVILTYSEMIKA